jgi:hypothetical protein
VRNWFPCISQFHQPNGYKTHYALRCFTFTWTEPIANKTTYPSRAHGFSLGFLGGVRVSHVFCVVLCCAVLCCVVLCCVCLVLLFFFVLCFISPILPLSLGFLILITPRFSLKFLSLYFDIIYLKTFLMYEFRSQRKCSFWAIRDNWVRSIVVQNGES